jgi:hypothetical protein
LFGLDRVDNVADLPDKRDYKSHPLQHIVEHKCLVGSLRSSYNPTDEKRFTATIALFHFDGTRVLWDEAVEKLSSYIEE